MTSNADKSLYMQVYSELYNKIQTGEWRVGDRIPPEMELCREYDVSRMTVRLAMQRLVDQGNVRRRQGKGTFVSEPQIEQKLDAFYSFGNQGERARSKVLMLATIGADHKVAKNLEIEEGEEVCRLERIRYFGDTVFAYENSYLPVRYGRKLSSAGIEDIGLYASLRELYGIVPQGAVEIFEAVNMRKREAACLGALENEAAMKIDRIAKAGDEIIEYCVSIVKGDKLKYRSELR